VTDPTAPATPVTATLPAKDGEGSQAGDVTQLRFDQALDELRGVVAQLERGGLPLEDSIALYERGAALHEHCAHLLDGAEARIGRLVDGSGGAPRLVDLRPDDDDDL
jgi:exodeoxyribonuclease VII small subunit